MWELGSFIPSRIPPHTIPSGLSGTRYCRWFTGLTSRVLYASRKRFLPLMLQYMQPMDMARQKQKK